MSMPTHLPTALPVLHCPFSILIDTEEPYLIEERQLRKNKNEQGCKVQTQWLPTKVAPMRCENEEKEWDNKQKLPVGRILHSIIQLLPESQLVIPPLIHFNRGALVPVEEVVCGHCVQEMRIRPRHARIHH
jgi:hypothetical protein